jgi:methylmalonyl-CoA mutase C-terminal domain/subunit
MELLKKEDLAKQLLVFAGGIIPKEDIPELSRIGISKVFGPGTSTKVIVAYLIKALKEKFQEG